LNIEKGAIYDVGNPGRDLRQAQQYGEAKLVNGIPTFNSYFLIISGKKS
jgi:hypothetical protein